MTRIGTIVLLLGLLTACGGESAPKVPAIALAAPQPGLQSGTANTCTGTWPSYWQDPDPKFAGQWKGQPITNQAPTGWSGPVFQLSDGFPDKPNDDKAAQPWRDAKYDAMFESGTASADKTRLAEEYAWAVMAYIQEGNIDDDADVEDDWDACENPVRPWYHMPFQTYDGLTGRDFTHGLTREAPVTFNLANTEHPGAGITINSTMWAVGFYNTTAAYTLGTVWKRDGTVAVPTKNLSFSEGAVVGKLLFNTDTPEQFSVLANMPTWTANISDPSYCKCQPAPGEKSCTLVEEAQQCGRSISEFGPVRLLQFDIAIKDSRAPQTQWVFGTFVADGVRKAGEANPWNRISPLGLMWGNATPPEGQPAADYPADPRKDGFADIVIFWDTVDMLNAAGGPIENLAPGHLGCNFRLNGPADNANSSCMSCHGTASVPDSNLQTPPIVTQFSGPPAAVTHECVTPDTQDPTIGFDASLNQASIVNGVGFTQVDSLWFANTGSGVSFNATAQVDGKAFNVLGDQPSYADGSPQWVTTDYSLQMSGALGSWLQWQSHAQQIDAAAADADAGEMPRLEWTAKVPRRGKVR